jgi:hypothetical protein
VAALSPRSETSRKLATGAGILFRSDKPVSAAGETYSRRIDNSRPATLLPTPVSAAGETSSRRMDIFRHTALSPTFETKGKSSTGVGTSFGSDKPDCCVLSQGRSLFSPRNKLQPTPVGINSRSDTPVCTLPTHRPSSPRLHGEHGWKTATNVRQSLSDIGCASVGLPLGEHERVQGRLREERRQDYLQFLDSQRKAILLLLMSCYCSFFLLVLFFFSSCL